MRSSTSLSIPFQLQVKQQILATSLNDAEIRGAVASCGYTLDRLREGQRKLEAVFSAMHMQKMCAGVVRTRVLAMHDIETAAHGAYHRVLYAAQVAAAQRGHDLAHFGAASEAPRSRSRFLAAAYLFFEQVHANPALAEALAAYGYGAKQLAQEWSQIEALDEAQAALQAALNKAQEATCVQRAAISELKRWMQAYTQVAKRALHDKPEALIRLGLRVKTATV